MPNFKRVPQRALGSVSLALISPLFRKVTRDSMKTKSWLIIFLMSAASISFAEINWVAMVNYKSGDLAFCPEVVEWISENEKQTQQFIEAGIANYGGDAGYHMMDLNNDLHNDVFVVYAGPGTCGSGGCSSAFFLGGSKACKQLYAPSWHFDYPRDST